jgi:hypothetical protein
MIFHSANNLRKRKEKKKEKKKKRKKKNKRGHKINWIEPHAITVTWFIQFKHGQVLLN